MPTAIPRDEETLAGLQLIRTNGVGPVTYHDLIARFGTAQDALTALPDLAKRAGRRKTPKVISLDSIKLELSKLEKIGGHLVRHGDIEYPDNLRQMSDAPPFLFVSGDLTHLTKPAIAIVGARNASLNGKKIAGMLAADITKAGYTIWSGMARGIDTAAHTSAIKQSTVAVVAGGIDIIYPRENAGLHADIVQNGAVVSEMPPGTEPQARHFPRRNRIISGASVAVIIVEGTPKSGSLITARFALDQGREVFAVPGSPLDPRSQGPNNLIRDGATLIRSADDVLDELAAASKNLFSALTQPRIASQPIESIDEKEVDSTRLQILQEIGSTAVTVDELRRQCQVSAPVMAAALLELELADRIERLPGNKICRIG
jgi:DNA processing protein